MTDGCARAKKSKMRFWAKCLGNKFFKLLVTEFLWFIIINTLFTWLSYGDKNVKQFFGFTYNALMSMLKIIRCKTWGRDTCVWVLCYFCSVFLNWPILSLVYLKYRTFQWLTLHQLNKGRKPISLLWPIRYCCCALSDRANMAPTYHRPYSSLYKPHTRVTGFLFGFLTHEARTNGLYRNIGKQIPLVTAK